VAFFYTHDSYFEKTFGEIMFYWRLKPDQLVTIRIRKRVFQIKGPKAHAYFSERYGYKRPFLKIGGWRFFWFKLGEF